MKLFIGIAPGDYTRAALAATAEQLGQRISARWTDPSLYHLTLAFLGELPSRSVDSVEEAMAEAREGQHAFPLTLGALGSFGSVLWRGVEPSDALFDLAASLRIALSKAGIVYDERPFTPHITLARDMERSYREEEPLPPATFQVRDMILYESVQVAEGVQYRECLRVLLDS